jgi:hypothetical protein
MTVIFNQIKNGYRVVRVPDNYFSTLSLHERKRKCDYCNRMFPLDDTRQGCQLTLIDELERNAECS